MGTIPSLGTPQFAAPGPYELAEGPLWDDGAVRWVDIYRGVVVSATLTDEGMLDIHGETRFPDLATTVAVTTDGGLIVGGRDRLYHRSPDGTTTAGPALIDGALRRFNDGKPDPTGAMLIGTLSTAGPSLSERLIRVSPDGTVTVLDDDLTLSNGLGFSPDGTVLYSVDTLTRRIFRRPYDDPAGGAAGPSPAPTYGPRELLVELPAELGSPDGMTVDAEGHLWVAIWGGSCVLRLSPDGQLVGRVDLPAPHVSCPAFVGPDLATLVITTATEHMTAATRAEFPRAGGLFTVRPGVRGLPPLVASTRVAA